MVTVTPGTVRIGGNEIPTAGMKRAQIATSVKGVLLAERQSTRDHRVDSLTLIASPDAKWEFIVAVADGAAKAGLKLNLAFEVPRRLPLKPAPSPLGDKLAATSGDPIAHAEVSQELFNTCAPATSAFRVSGDPREIHQKLVLEIPRALKDCACTPSPEDARTWFWHVAFTPDLPGTVVLQVRILPGGDPRAVPVLASASEPWQNVVARVIEAAQPGTENHVVQFVAK